ncbi:hypothetical protein Tsubulata_025384 [Turnera subulata]|uniref:Uncharacterized protein n=1 Tax=Turnera subulata TaxID=218843 RepID=A0A9Q0G899_9ROSI|nr:hypothetical protein Tsubulata_025384 [Turnera subulata]
MADPAALSSGSQLPANGVAGFVSAALLRRLRATERCAGMEKRRVEAIAADGAAGFVSAALLRRLRATERCAGVEKRRVAAVAGDGGGFGGGSAAVDRRRKEKEERIWVLQRVKAVWAPLTTSGAQHACPNLSLLLLIIWTLVLVCAMHKKEMEGMQMFLGDEMRGVSVNTLPVMDEFEKVEEESMLDFGSASESEPKNKAAQPELVLSPLGECGNEGTLLEIQEILKTPTPCVVHDHHDVSSDEAKEIVMEERKEDEVKIEENKEEEVKPPPQPVQPRICWSTEVRPRLRWTQELHAYFVNAVNHLGGPQSQ